MPKTKAKKILHCFWQAAVDAVNHDGVEHAGYLSFVTLLAICPFLVLLTTIASWFGELQLGGYFIQMMLDNLPRDVAKGLEPRIVELAAGPPQGLLPIALIAAVWTSSSTIEGMRTVLNRAYRVSTPPSYWFRRSLSILQFLMFTAALMVILMILIFAPLAGEFIKNHISLDVAMYLQIKLIGMLLISLVLFVIVALFYYLLPNIKQTLKDVVPGAALTVVLWILTASLFSSYLAHFDQVNVVYGSLEGIIVSLFFFYMMNLIFIYGAEFNHLFDKAIGRKFVEKEKGGAT